MLLRSGVLPISPSPSTGQRSPKDPVSPSQYRTFFAILVVSEIQAEIIQFEQKKKEKYGQVGTFW